MIEHWLHQFRAPTF